MSGILVLDDDAQFGDLIKILLEMEGYQVTVLQAPEKMIPVASQIDPALILMDVHVASVETFDLLLEVKANADLKDVPVVMTSGLNYSAKCLERGAAAFLFKPFRPTELLGTIAGLIDG